MQSESARQYVWRNVAVEIAPGRFSRDHWVQELWHERDKQPKRSSEGKGREGQHITLARPQHVKSGPKYSPESCPATKGMYALVRTEPTPKGNSFQVVARCTGVWCGGSVRTFSVWGWCQQNPNLQGCSRCTQATRRQMLEANRAARRAQGLPLINTRGKLS